MTSHIKLYQKHHRQFQQSGFITPFHPYLSLSSSSQNICLSCGSLLALDYIYRKQGIKNHKECIQWQGVHLCICV